jgi:hypothetical protein
LRGIGDNALQADEVSKARMRDCAGRGHATVKPVVATDWGRGRT